MKYLKYFESTELSKNKMDIVMEDVNNILLDLSDDEFSIDSNLETRYTSQLRDRVTNYLIHIKISKPDSDKKYTEFDIIDIKPTIDRIKKYFDIMGIYVISATHNSFSGKRRGYIHGKSIEDHIPADIVEIEYMISKNSNMIKEGRRVNDICNTLEDILLGVSDEYLFYRIYLMNPTLCKNKLDENSAIEIHNNWKNFDYRKVEDVIHQVENYLKQEGIYGSTYTAPICEQENMKNLPDDGIVRCVMISFNLPDNINEELGSHQYTVRSDEEVVDDETATIIDDTLLYLEDEGFRYDYTMDKDQTDKLNQYKNDTTSGWYNQRNILNIFIYIGEKAAEQKE